MEESHTASKQRKAAQSFPIVTALFDDPLVIHGLSQGERSLMGYLTLAVWRQRDLIIRGSAGFLKNNTGQSVSSIKRHLAGLIDLRLVRVEHRGKYPAKTPNWYLVEPIFLAEHKWKGHPATSTRPEEKPIENLIHSRFFDMVQKGPSGIVECWASIENMVQKEPRLGSKRTMWEKVLGSCSVQKELQIYILYSLLLSRTPRHSPKDDPAAALQGEFGIEVPCGPVQKPKQKGAARGGSLEEISGRIGARIKERSAGNRL